MNRGRALDRLQSARSGENEYKRMEMVGWRKTDGGKPKETKWRGNAEKRQRETCRRQRGSGREINVKLAVFMGYVQAERKHA